MPSTPTLKTQTQVKSASELQEELTNLALRIAQEGYGIKLDFSTYSIKQVELILGDVGRGYKQNHNDKGLHGIALEFAAYIITTIERTTQKGRWDRNHPVLGENTFPYYWKDLTIFPYTWCTKRIFEGDAENIWVKYQSFIVQHEK